jgi:ribonucleotide monophosphatase NagD (HAD superfamily)
VYVIGEDGIEHELDAVGIKHKGGTVGSRTARGLIMLMSVRIRRTTSSCPAWTLRRSTRILKWELCFVALMCVPHMAPNAADLATDAHQLQKASESLQVLARQSRLSVHSDKRWYGCRYFLGDAHIGRADSTFPTRNTMFPGSGAISAPLRFALPHKKPITVGKPNQPMLDGILERSVPPGFRVVRLKPNR